ncbi:MAG: hypothetical protein J0M04_17270 [Verrucomicrobia bacterium]|nr:hypothetical protein [Verrucomicrobiota bacterium]
MKRNHLTALASVLATFGLASLTAFATDSSLDGAFVSATGPGITPDGYPTWNNGTGAVNAVALQSDGKIVIGGNLSRYQAPPAGSPRTSLKRLNADGTFDSAFNAFASTLADTQGDTEVNKIIVTTGDKMYVGGVFQSYQGTSRSGIMRLNADGSLDTGFNLGGVSNTVSFGSRYVLAIAEQTDGKVLVGGAFNRLTSGSVFVAANLFRVDGNGARDTAFCDNVNASLANSSFVGDLAVLPDGKILVAGGLNKAGGGSTPLLVRLNADGTTDTSFSVAFGTDYGDIDELLVLPDGRILIGGDVSFAATGTHYYFACLNSDGTLNTAFMNNIGSGPGGWAGGELALQPDGTILVGGIFFQWNNQPRASIARLNPDGTLDGGLNIAPYSTTPGQYGTHIYSMVVQPDGKLVAGGWFNYITDTAVEHYNLVRFNNEYAPTEPGTIRAVSATITTAENAGSVSVPLSRFGGLTGAVSVSYSITPVNAVPGTDYTAVSGSLSWTAGEGGVKNISIPILQDTAQDGPRLFTVNLTGAAGGAFLPPSADETVVTIRDDDTAPMIVTPPVAVSVEQGAKFVVGILYDSVLPATVQWQRDSGSGFVNIPGATSISYTVSAADSATHAGTYRAIVTNANGSTESTGAAVSISVPAGSLVTSFAPTGLIINNAAQNLTIDSAGRYLVASASQLRRLNPDGTFDATTSFGINVSTINSVLHLANGYTYVGGNFGTITHTPSGATSTVSSRLFRLNNNATATIDTSWSYAVNGTGGVTALAPGAGGTLYVGSANAATSTNGIQRVKADGLNDTTWAPAANTVAAGTGATVYFIKELTDGKVLISHRHGSTYRLSRLTSTGALDTTFGTGGNIDFGTGNWVTGLDVLPDGRIAVSGRFNVDFFTPGQRYLAILNADGTPDTSFQFGSSVLNGNPNGVIYRDGRLFVWGGFTTVNGNTQAGVVSVNLDGSVDSTFSAGVGVAGGTPVINAAKFTSTGEIFIAGNFTSYKGVTRNYTALLVGNPQVGTIGFAPPRVTTLEEAAPLALTLKRYGDSTQAVSIDWATANGTATAGVDFAAASGTVSWAAGDTADKTITVNKLENATVHANRVFTIALSNPSGPVGAGAPATVTLIDDDTPAFFTAQPASAASLLTGGSLNLSATTSSPSPTTYQWFRNGVAIAGATATSFAKSNLTMADAGVYTLVATNAAGSVTSTAALVTIRLNPANLAPDWPLTLTINGTVSALVATADGGAYVGGAFTNFNGSGRNYLVKISATGVVDTSFDPAPNNTVTALELSGSRLYALGTFTQAGGGAALNNFTALDAATGARDATFMTALGTGANSTVRCMTVLSDSDLLLGGDFTTYNSNTSHRYLARINSDGSLHTPFNTSTATGTSNIVTALGAGANGSFVVGGSLSYGGMSRFLRCAADGTVDTAFAPTGQGSSTTFSRIRVLADGRVMASGSNLPPSNRGVTRLSTTGAWSSADFFGPTSGSFTDFVHQANGRTVGTGTFSFVRLPSGSGNFSNIASFDTVGALDQTWATGTGFDNTTNAIAQRPDGQLWVGGNFLNYNGTAVQRLARIGGDPANPAIVNQPTATGVAPGSTAYLGVGASGTGLTYQWLKNGSPLANGGNISGATSAVLAISNASPADDADYTVEVTGGVTTIASSTAHLYVLGAPLVVSQPAAATPALGSTLSLTAGVYAASPATYTWTRDGVPIINGGRYSGATTPSLAIAGVNAVDNGNYTLTVTNGLGTISTTAATIAVASVPATRDPSAALTALGTSTNAVNAFLHLPDGRTLIGSDSGVVGTGGANVASGLAIVDTAGVPALAAAGSFNGSVQAILRQPDGKVLVAGGFTTIGGTGGNGRVRIARLNADLTLDTSFNPAQPSNNVFRLALDSAGRIYLQGSFLNLDGQTGYSYLVRLRADGSLDLDFKPSIGGSMFSMLMMPDDSLLVGGSITAYSHGGVLTTINGLVRIAPSGAVASGFTSGLPANSSVQAIDLDATGRLAMLVNVAGTGSIYRMENDGSLVAGFSSPVAFNNFCRSVVALPSGGFLVGGDFTSPSARLARVNADGTLDTMFNIGTGFTVTSGTQPTVNAIAPDAFGRLWLGGSRFTSYNGSTANRLVVLQGEGSPAFAISQQPAAQTVDVGAASVSFTVGVAANNGFTFQWRRAGQPLADGGRISGAASSTLTIANVLTSDAQLYDVVVSKPDGPTTTASLTSNSAALTVLSTPEILSQPAGLTREIGASATFTAQSRGAGTLSYQWLLNGSPLANGTSGGVTISGATTQSLTVTGVGFAQAGSYRLRVTNTLGEVTSSAAVLTVERRPGSLAPGIGNPTANNAVLAILRLADGSMLVGGQFTSITVNGVVNNRSRLARFLADGTLDPSFTPTFSGDVRALAQDSAGRVFIGGSFTGNITVGGVTASRTRVARLTSALALDIAFDTSAAGPNAQINAVAPTDDGGVYVGGAFGFNLVGATSVNRVARLSATGALDTGFTVLTTVINNEVKALLRRSDGKLYAGGTFGTVLLESTGTKDTAFAAAAPSILAVQGQSMLQLSGGDLILGANGALPQPYLRRLNANTGASLTDFASGHASMVSALAVQADGKVLSGSIGSFKRSNPLTGADDTGFASFDSTISALAVDGAGRIWVGGAFGTFNGAAQARLAVLNGGEFESQSGPVMPQTITFPAIADKTTLDDPFVLNATSDSGLPVSYQISGPANLSGSTVTLTGSTGLVTITATQAGNATTAAATPVVRTFTVTAAPPLQTFLANAGVPANKRGPNDDPDNDGIPNLIEFGLGLAPNTPDASALPEGVSGGGNLSITYRRAQPGLVYVVETSPTLTGGTWTSIGVNQGTPDGNGWTTASIPLGPNAGFLRVSVTINP